MAEEELLPDVEGDPVDLLPIVPEGALLGALMLEEGEEEEGPVLRAGGAEAEAAADMADRPATLGTLGGSTTHAEEGQC